MNKDAWKDERNLEDEVDEIPFAYNEDGECMYCGNMEAVENDNKNLIEQNSRILKLLHKKDKIIEKLTNKSKSDIEMKTRQLEIIDHYGLNNQLNQLVEECGELIVAISKLNRFVGSEGMSYTSLIIAEMADVLNLIEQVSLKSKMYDEGIKATKQFKVYREIDRISKE